MGGQSFIDQADALVDSGKVEDLSLDLQSYVATYKAKRDAGDTRASAAWARALVNRAAREGFSAKVDKTIDDLRDEIATRNEGREEADLIKPAGRKKSDLQAALDADDAK